ncbi:uncharacterized protein LOC124809656 isoform X1 [Hydra vulgaris]|uniref:uncharacterized protein LOC124809656 isoform X1 n=1 Tax=Hydra vulgaris TaxID=6087 RepID=UPI001F5FBC7E|nr:uncharacterized protein LOC124809656 [Hydra vulgaris]
MENNFKKNCNSSFVNDDIREFIDNEFSFLNTISYPNDTDKDLSLTPIVFQSYMLNTRHVNQKQPAAKFETKYFKRKKKELSSVVNSQEILSSKTVVLQLNQKEESGTSNFVRKLNLNQHKVTQKVIENECTNDQPYLNDELQSLGRLSSSNKPLLNKTPLLNSSSLGKSLFKELVTKTWNKKRVEREKTDLCQNTCNGLISFEV